MNNLSADVDRIRPILTPFMLIPQLLLHLEDAHNLYYS